MKPRTLSIVAALTMAAVGTGGLLAYVHSANQRAVDGLKAVSTLVARQTIPTGTSAASAVRQGFLATERLPASSVPAGAVRAITSGLASLVLDSTVQPGQLLLRSALVPPGHAGPVGPLAIPTGMVAVTVPLCMPAAVAGYVGPGSQVAVFDTYGIGKATISPDCGGTANSQADINSISTRLVLPRVEVLSVTPAKGRSGSSASTAQGAVPVTFAVSQADAQRLITLTEAGVPYLALLTPTSQTGFSAAVPPLFQP